VESSFRAAKRADSAFSEAARTKLSSACRKRGHDDQPELASDRRLAELSFCPNVVRHIMRYESPVIWPPAWKPGMHIGIISTSSSTAYDFPSRVETGRRNLSAAFSAKVIEIPVRIAKAGFVVERPETVAEHLHRLFLDEQVGLIVAAIGGFNTNSILPHLNWELLRANPTYLCGYSDTSALLNAMISRAGIGALHGPALLPQWGDPRGPFKETIDAFHAAVATPDLARKLKYPGFWCDPRTDWNSADLKQTFHEKSIADEPWRALKGGAARGSLIGGNIETINMLLGTPFCPDFTDKVLFIEATGAEAYLPRFKRALTHLGNAGVFSRIKGMIVGRCPDARPVSGTTLDEVLLDVLRGTDFPVIVDVDLGHTEPMITLPIGASVALVAEPGEVALHLEPR
jgi:muramoyltetrapeptide carboxypeptidase